MHKICDYGIIAKIYLGKQIVEAEMEEVLNKVNYPEDIKNLNLEEKEKLAEELRKLILNVVSKNGGHLASNLGVVELTIALHDVFNLPEDKIIWDVGHQTYVHKILTGRKYRIDTLRQFRRIIRISQSRRIRI